MINKRIRTLWNSKAGRQRTILYHRAAIFASRRSIDLLTGSDFNSVLHPTDTTGHFEHSRALSEMIRGLELHDAWKQNPPDLHTHTTSPHGATTLDRFYITSEIQQKNGDRNYACRLDGPLRCRDTHYSTRHRPAESTREMEDGFHTDNR